jgi:FHA domain-containing protein
MRQRSGGQTTLQGGASSIERRAAALREAVCPQRYARAVGGDDLALEIVEGPGAGRRLVLEAPVVLGRAADADLVLEDEQVSGHHARVSPTSAGSAIVEDLGSTNGTFVNDNEVQGPSTIDPDDELLLGVTLLQVRTRRQLEHQPSAVRAVPPPLATAQGVPDYVGQGVLRAGSGRPAPGSRSSELDKYLDVHVRRRAQLAPLALFVLVALALMIYFAVH